MCHGVKRASLGRKVPICGARLSGGENISLDEEVADDFAVNVGKAVVAAAVAVGEAGVIHAEEMENGGVEVVHVDAVFGDGGADFVGAAVGEAAFDARAGQPG